MHVVPIDLEPFRLGDEADRHAVAHRIDHAGRTSGFLAITGHGIAADLLDEMMAVTTEFFDLPVEDKMRCWVEDRTANRGYAPEGSESLAYSIGEADLPPDLFEAFNTGREILPDQEDDPYVSEVRETFFAPNVWPEAPARFREVWIDYFAAVEALGLTVMDAAAMALGLPDGWFRPFIDRSISVLRAINYERRAGAPAPLPDQMRMGAHSDYGSVTLLLADPVPGLQILDDDGTWHDVLPPEGGFLVNIGDLLAEWTNDRWRSTMHRVVPPPHEGDGSARRRSIAFFQQPNWDAVIEVLPTCVEEGASPRYRPVRSGEHLLAKLMGPRLGRPSEPSPALLD